MISVPARPGVPATTLGRWPRRAGWLLLIVGLAGTLGVAWVGHELTQDHPRTGPELPVNQWLAQHRVGWLTRIAEVVHVGVGPLVGPLLALLACVLIWWRGHRRFALTAATITLVTWLSTGLTKLVVERPRPPGELVQALFVARGHDSYPSGHTAFASALVAGLAGAAWVTGRRVWPWLVVGLGFIAVVGASRLYAGVHYLADVLAGVADVGFAYMMLTGVTLLIDRRCPQWGVLPSITDPSEHPPAQLTAER